MHTFLIHAVPVALVCNLPRPNAQAIFACVATGNPDEAQGVVLGEFHRAGWKTLEVLPPSLVREQFPGLKRHPEAARVMAAARQRGVAFLLLDLAGL